MVELATINKALREIARSNFRKKIFLLKKSKNMFLSIICTFGYSWSQPFQLTIKKNKRHTMPENMRPASAEHLMLFGVGTHSKRRP